MNHRMTFDRKGYGRFFVEKEEDVDRVKSIMREIDNYEYDGYYPTGQYLGGNGELVTVFSPENYYAIYVGKFDDMDMTEVLARAWEQGIKCFVVFGKITGYEDL